MINIHIETKSKLNNNISQISTGVLELQTIMVKTITLLCWHEINIYANFGPMRKVVYLQAEFESFFIFLT